MPKIQRVLLGKYSAPLQEWIERRLPDDIAVDMDDARRTVLFLLTPLDQVDCKGIATNKNGQSIQWVKPAQVGETSSFEGLP